VSSGVLAAAAL